MNKGEHENLARVEERLWWYQGLRETMISTLGAQGSTLPPNPRVLDAGCGTGRNLALLETLLEPSYLGGFDLSETALDFARVKAPQAKLRTGDICDPQLDEVDLDLIVSLDVIYIPGAERALSGLKKLVDALRPGGMLLLNLPAYNWLYSQHDVALHTSERYTVGSVRRLLNELGLEISLLTYRVCLVFPLGVATRLPSMMRARPGDEEAQSQLFYVPPDLINRTLLSTIKVENALISRGVTLPFGLSVYASGKKR